MRVLILALLAAAVAPAQRFYPDDPLQSAPPPMRVEDAEFRKLNDYYDLLLHTLAKPGERQPKKGEPIRALSTNTIDEVPDDPAWFVNRVGSRPITPAEVVRGAGDERPPKPGVWTIIAAKTEGVTPGFRIVDSSGERYLLKFDPLDHPEMATGADIVGSLAFHALGYNVPENYLVFFDREDLEVDDDATMPDAKGIDRPITKFDVDHALLRVPRRADGKIRGIASRFLEGKILGEFRYLGTRADDPNDVIPHEHRRELRGLHVFDAWLNHNDSRAINDLDALVEEEGRKFIKHFLIDFGAILGSASVLSNTARDGNAYFYEPKKALAQAFTLGLHVPYWARAKYAKSPAVGMINSDAFRPDEWKPNYPNPAFDNRLPDDEFWAAKKVAAFDDALIEAIVGAARYSDPADTRMLIDYLAERRDILVRHYFGKVLPLDRFRVEGSTLRFDDLGERHGLGATRGLEIMWASYDNATDEHAPLPGAGPQLPDAHRRAAAGAYFSATIAAGEAGKSTVVWVRKEAAGARVVGVERRWP